MSIIHTIYTPSRKSYSRTYRLWESSWAEDAVKRDVATDTYTDPSKVRQINHKGKYYKLESAHNVDPTPQRTPFLFQAGTSPLVTPSLPYDIWCSPF